MCAGTIPMPMHRPPRLPRFRAKSRGTVRGIPQAPWILRRIREALRRLPEQGLHLLVKGLEGRMGRRRLRPHDDVAAGRKKILMRPGKNSETALDEIARHRVSDAFGYSKAQPDGAGRGIPRLGIRPPAKMHNEVTACDLGAPLQHVDEIAVTLQSLHLSLKVALRGQGLAALGATTIDGRTTGTGTHAHAEAVLHVTTTIIRLECPLHS
jgi:hypothetical protein